MSRAEYQRRLLIETGSPLAHHSMNQLKTKIAEEGRDRLWTLSKKEEKSLRRRERQQDALPETLITSSSEVSDFIQEICDLPISK